MAGLFTLDSATLGVLDTDVLGGFGTGYAIGDSTTTGLVVGVLGHSGSVSGAGTSSGVVVGAEGAFGEVRGVSSNAGSVVGVAQTARRGGRYQVYLPAPPTPTHAVGTVAGQSRSRGLVLGRVNVEALVRAASASSSRMLGTSRLDVRPIVLDIDFDSIRRKSEDELLLLEMLWP
jgi:hypothetical protein